MARPAITSDMDIATAITVIRKRLLYLSTLRTVDLYLNESRFQRGGMRSNITFLPALGGLGRSRFAGVSVIIFMPENSVANMMAATITQNTTKKKVTSKNADMGGMTYE